MSLCGDKHGSKKLYEFMRKEYDIEETNLLSFRNVLRSIGQFDHAEKYYRRLLNELSGDDPLLAHAYYNLGLADILKGDYESSLKHYKAVLKIATNNHSSDHVIIAKTHNGIGEIDWKSGDTTNIALFQDNMGLFYREQKNYCEALLYYARSLVILQKCLSKDHPDLGMSYNDVGTIRLHLNQLDLAVEYLKQALEIRERALPSEHPDVAIS
ncbi:unnamed protein product [Rotaria magnacalcarata]|uniref:Uncharacterized protein n=2 Tax=Rotaria magnacalcarata TaxID=392030 RepID=A0A816CD37_9BILA|nr:unnamed protein product [Rotaria magnacalcarata]CAF5052869.1 unnamed protein product [Rotaria magnacalcarata]